MKIAEFEKKITHLSQAEIVSTALSVIVKILIEKGIATEYELQNKFLELAPKKKSKKRRTIKDPPPMSAKNSKLAKRGITQEMIVQEVKKIRKGKQKAN